jgi:hypothetical protein
VAATGEAVEIYRQLAAARSDAFEPDLAAAVNNLSVDLFEPGAARGRGGRHRRGGRDLPAAGLSHRVGRPEPGPPAERSIHVRTHERPRLPLSYETNQLRGSFLGQSRSRSWKTLGQIPSRQRAAQPLPWIPCSERRRG